MPRSHQPGTMRRVAALFRSYWGQLALLGLVVILTAELSVGNMLLIRPVFDRALFCPACLNFPLLFWLVGAMTVVPLVTTALGFWQPYLASVLGQRVMRALRDSLYAHLQRMPLRFFTETKIGEIQSRLVNDVGGLQQMLTETASAMLMYAMIPISTIGAMLLLSWQLTMLSLAFIPLFVWLTERVGRAWRTVRFSSQQAMAELFAYSEETLSVSGVLLSRLFG